MRALNVKLPDLKVHRSSHGSATQNLLVYRVYEFLPRGETNGCEVNFTEFKLMATLSLKERSLARQLAKRPWYSYGTTSVARLLGIKKTDLVALAKSLGDKTGDQVQRSTN